MMQYFSQNIRLLALTAALLTPALAVTACQNQSESREIAAFGDGAKRLGDTKVAEVNGTAVFLSDVERATASNNAAGKSAPLTTADPRFKTALEEVIDQRLLALDALQQGLDQRDETRRRLKAAEERVLGNIRVEAALAEAISPENVQRMYDEQSRLSGRGPERRARHILLESKAEAEAIFKSLESGADFAALAREKSQDNGTANKGGELGYFSRDMLDTDFTGPIFKAKLGTRIGPFKTEYGWHVAEVIDARLPQQASFEEMQAEITNFMTFDAIQTLLKDLRKQGQVKLLYDPAAESNTAPAIEDVNPDE
jgi:peptidyl-prolyl cis-trans isomerase C